MTSRAPVTCPVRGPFGGAAPPGTTPPMLRFVSRQRQRFRRRGLLPLRVQNRYDRRHPRRTACKRLLLCAVAFACVYALRRTTRPLDRLAVEEALEEEAEEEEEEEEEEEVLLEAVRPLGEAQYRLGASRATGGQAEKVPGAFELILGAHSALIASEEADASVALGTWMELESCLRDAATCAPLSPERLALRGSEGYFLPKAFLATPPSL